MTKKLLLFLLAALTTIPECGARKYVFRMEDYGITPSAGDCTPRLVRFLHEQRKRHAFTPDDRVVLKFRKGEYHFHSTEAVLKDTYVSNHDQWQPKKIVFDLTGWHNLTLDGGGADFIFYGTVIPIALQHARNCTLRDFSIDFAQPKMTPLEIIESDTLRGITFRAPRWANCYISDDGYFQTRGEDWEYRPVTGMAFDSATHHLIYRGGEFPIDTREVQPIAPFLFRAPHWKNAALRPGMVVAARDWNRPTPAIFLNEDRDTHVLNVRVHYAFGMGLLAQRCENILLDRFAVCPNERSGHAKRYFTTHADATHFSQCKGLITSRRGLYEGMMDDAINVHGIYLKVIRRLSDHALVCAFGHEQAWGFNWGNSGDEVQFIHAGTMEPFAPNTIAAIRPYDQTELRGMRTFRIEFARPLPDDVQGGEGIGLENLTWHPEVDFSRNTVRNNRARGALFSSPRRTRCERNTFDHVSGTAILLCGDCNGWYESGACRDITIRKNTFRNCLTDYFQFTNAIISIYPEIPRLQEQQAYFHANVRIEDNRFDTFDAPLLYAKSVDGITFRGNRIRRNSDFPPFHWNREPVKLERVTNAHIQPLGE